MNDIVKDLIDKATMVLNYIETLYEVETHKIVDKKLSKGTSHFWSTTTKVLTTKIIIVDKTNKHEVRAFDIEQDITLMFGFGKELSSAILREWAKKHGITDDNVTWTPEANIEVGGLRAQWNPNLANDLSFYHGIDAVAELE